MVDPAVLAEYVRASGLDWKQNGASWIFDCPRCGKKKLFFSKTTGNFTCWKCKETTGFKGSAEYGFAELLGRPVAEVRRALLGDEGGACEALLEIVLKDFYGDEEPPAEAVAATIPEVSWPHDYYPIGDERSKRGREYLEGRGVPADVAARYGVRYSPEERSVVFPVEAGGKLYGWQRRLVIPHAFENAAGETVEVPKSPTMPGMKREHLLMFADRLRGFGHAVLCEGPIDAIKADLCGGNVATMGKAAGRRQLEIVRGAGIGRVYLALDPDAADEVERVARDFFDLEIYEMFAPEGRGDLGAMSFAEVRELFEAAPKVEAGRVFVYVENRWPTPPIAGAST